MIEGYVWQILVKEGGLFTHTPPPPTHSSASSLIHPWAAQKKPYIVYAPRPVYALVKPIVKKIAYKHAWKNSVIGSEPKLISSKIERDKKIWYLFLLKFLLLLPKIDIWSVVFNQILKFS